jgi:hypothetical protein
METFLAMYNFASEFKRFPDIRRKFAGGRLEIGVLSNPLLVLIDPKSRAMHAFIEAWGAPLAIAVAVIFGAWLRFRGLDWDHGFFMHPDELHLIYGSAGLHFSWGADPKVYTYNGLALFLPRLVTAIQFLFGLIANPDALENLSHAARLISSTSSVALIVVLAWTVCISFGPWSGVLVAWLAACDVGLVQAAHFGTTESSLVLVIAILGLFAAAYIKGRITLWPYLIVSSIFIALGCGVKTTCAAAAIIPLIGLCLSPRSPQIRQIIYAFPICSIVFFSIFFVVSPHSILYMSEFLRVMRFEHGVVSGQLDVFWTRQFAGTLPFLFQIAQLPWISGPFVPVLGLIGIGIICIRSRKLESVRALLPISLFSIVYFVYIGQWHAKYVRYLLPLTPGLLIGASVAATLIWERAPRARRRTAICIVLTVTTSIIWAVTFSNIYGHEDSRITASRYLLNHIQAGQMILGEPFDVGLPVRVIAAPKHTVEVLPLMEENPVDVLPKYASKIASASWIVIASQRNYRSFPRLPQRFPFVCPYYRALLDGTLGFQLVERVSNYPTLFGVAIDTRNAEETFTVFDHPEVLVFHKTSDLSAIDIANQIMSHERARPSCGVRDF